MKKILMIMVSGLLMVQGYAYYDNRCVPECCNGFDGVYIGGTVGFAFHDYTLVDRDSWAGDIGGRFVSISDGVGLGVQLGYNLQCECELVGLELDINWASFQKISHLNPVFPTGLLGDTDFSFKNDTKWFGSIRARVGIIESNLLFFATAGAAWVNINQSSTINNTIFGPETFNVHNVCWGLAAGGGIEWKFFNSFRFKVEALYHKFPERSTNFFSLRRGEVNLDLLNDIWIVRIGLNYRLRSIFSCLSV